MTKFELDAEGFPSVIDQDILHTVASILAIARQEAYDRQDPSIGDDAQVLGIRAYKCAIKYFLEMNDARIEVLDPKGRCTLILNGVPVRFWRTDDFDSNPEEKRLILSPLTQQIELELSAPSNEPPIDRWGITYTTDTEGLLNAAVFAGYNSQFNYLVKHKEIPLDNHKYGPINIDPQTLPQAVKVPQAKTIIALKKKPDADDKNSRE